MGHEIGGEKPEDALECQLANKNIFDPENIRISIHLSKH